MATYIKVISKVDLPSGSMKTVIAANKKIALANIDGEFFAIDDTCSHAQCSLGGEGFLDGNVVTCGCHGAQFDVKSGRVMSLPAPTDVGSYPVKVDGNDVFVDI